MTDVPDLGATPDLNSFGDAERIWIRYSLDEALRRAVLNTAGFVRAQALGIARIVTGAPALRPFTEPLK